jgi:hypothetical protein
MENPSDRNIPAFPGTVPPKFSRQFDRNTPPVDLVFCDLNLGSSLGRCGK